MKVIQQSVKIVDNIEGLDILKKIEYAGRKCYKSEDKITTDSAVEFIQKIIQLGHESVLEHCNITVEFVTDRGVTHEIVRHRIASYSQESTRYCNYGQGKFKGELTFIEPVTMVNNETWLKSMLESEVNYFQLLREGFKQEDARSVLPNSLKSELVMTANIREWRYFLKLRTSKKAHPQMRDLAKKLLKQLQDKIPILFEDINENN